MYPLFLVPGKYSVYLLSIFRYLKTPYSTRQHNNTEFVLLLQDLNKGFPYSSSTTSYCNGCHGQYSPRSGLLWRLAVRCSVDWGRRMARVSRVSRFPCFPMVDAPLLWGTSDDFTVGPRSKSSRASYLVTKPTKMLNWTSKQYFINLHEFLYRAE